MDHYSTNWTIKKHSDKSGGQGTISIVENIKDRKLIGALKEMHPEQQKNKIKRERMCREIDALIKVAEKGVPKIYEHNSNDKDDFSIPLYFISQWIEGKNLHELYFKKPTSLDDAIRITRELCLIVDRCHHEGVLHRDIKPHNIVISISNEIYLVDFGLAWIKPLRENERDFNSLPHEEMSNFFLRLPELIAGYEKHTEVSDVTYLVGILFFLLTGQYPKSPADGVGNPPHKILKQYFSTALTSDLRWPKVTRIFNVGFQPSTDHRIQSAIELIQMLDEINKSLSNKKELDVANNPSVQKLQELLSATSLKMKSEFLNRFQEINTQTLSKLYSIAQHYGLEAASNNPTGQNYRSINLYFSNITLSDEQVILNHTLELIDKEGTKMRASFSIDSSQPEIYYTGYSSDVDGLATATENAVNDIFPKVADAYTKKIGRKTHAKSSKILNANPLLFQVCFKDNNEKDLVGGTVLLVADNNTFLKEITNQTGIANFQINTSRDYKLYFAHEYSPSFIVEKINPNISTNTFNIPSLKNTGSIVCMGSGSIPGLKGTLNPILDGRTYLYTDNIAVNGGGSQPVDFKVNEPLHFEDCDGVSMQVTIKDIQGESSLIEYVLHTSE